MNTESAGSTIFASWFQTEAPLTTKELSDFRDRLVAGDPVTRHAIIRLWITARAALANPTPESALREEKGLAFLLRACSDEDWDEFARRLIECGVRWPDDPDAGERLRAALSAQPSEPGETVP